MKYSELIEAAPSKELIILTRLRQLCSKGEVPNALTGLVYQNRNGVKWLEWTSSHDSIIMFSMYHLTLQTTVSVDDPKGTKLWDELEHMAEDLDISNYADIHKLDFGSERFFEDWESTIPYTDPRIAHLKPWTDLISQTLSLNDPSKIQKICDFLINHCAHANLTEAAPAQREILLRRLKTLCMQKEIPAALVRTDLKENWSGYFLRHNCSGVANIDFTATSLEIHVDNLTNNQLMLTEQLQNIASDLTLTENEKQLFYAKCATSPFNKPFYAAFAYSDPCLHSLKPWCNIIGQIISLHDKQLLDSAVDTLYASYRKKSASLTEAAPKTSLILLTRVKQAINKQTPIPPAFARLEPMKNDPIVRCEAVQPNTALYFEGPNRLTLIYSGSQHTGKHLQQLRHNLNLTMEQTERLIKATPADDNHWNGWEDGLGGYLEFETTTADPIFANLQPFSGLICQLCHTEDLNAIEQAVIEIMTAAKQQHGYK